MKLIIADQIPNIDRVTFNWTFPDKKNLEHVTYPPALWEKNGIYYQLNYFRHYTDKYFLIENSNFPDAFSFTTGFYSSEHLNVIELSNLLFLVETFGYNISDFGLFEKYGVAGNRKIKTLRALKDLPESIKKYIALKNFSFKTLNLLTRLPENIIGIIESYIVTKSPSVSDFKKMVEKLFDMKENVPRELTIYDKNELEKIFMSKNMIQNNFIKELKLLTDQIKSVEIKNTDNFETDTLELSFKINSSEDFERIMDQMFNKKEIIKDIYKLMERYDLH